MQSNFTVFSITYVLFGVLISAFTELSAQTAIGGNTPDGSAMLDVQSTERGVLLPRVANSANISNPATGLMVFNTGSNCLEINLGLPSAPNWQSITCGPTCGAYTEPGVRKRFLCHNLGVANSSADPFTPSWEIIGGYWQWGTLAQAAPGPTGTNGSIPNEGLPNTWTPPGSAWNTVVDPNNFWTENAKSPTDPCPEGFRVPSKAEWEGVLTNTALNPQTLVGTSPWSSGITNYSNGIKFGNDLFLPAAGNRPGLAGTLNGRGRYGDYWSSTSVGLPSGAILYFDDTDVRTGTDDRRNGNSVRCIEE